MHGRRLISALAVASLALPATLALADGEDDTTFSGDGAVYLDTGAGGQNPVYAGQPIVARASDGDLLMGTVVNRPSEFNNSRGGPIFDVELRVYKLDHDGELDDAWGGGDGIASAETTTNGNSTVQALALRGLDDGGAILVADDSGTDGVMAVHFDADGLPPDVAETVAKHDGPSGCTIAPDFAEFGVGSEFLAFWSNRCYGPSDKCPIGNRGQTTCDDSARSRYQRYEWTSSTAIAAVNDPEGIPLLPLGNEMHIDDVAVSAAGAPSVLGGMTDIEQTTRGSSDSGPVILRFGTDDELDDSLDGDGIRPFGEEAFDFSYTGRFGLRPGGGYLVAYDEQVAGRGSDTGWELARFDADGALDETFGSDGLAAPDDEAFTCPYPHSVRVLPDDKVLLFRDRWDDNPCADAAVIARTTAGGELDPEFGTGGVRTFDFGQQNANLTSDNGDPLMLPDGRVVLPFLLNYFPSAPRVDPPDENGQYFALFRITGPPVQQEEEEEEQKPAVVSGGQAAAAAQGAAPPAGPRPPAVLPRRCLSRRSLTLRLRTGRRKKEQSRIRSVSVTVNGKKVKTTRRGARVNLRNLPKGRYTVVINLRLADGGRVRDVRRYRTCALKIERELAPLRTRPPRR